MNGTLMLVRLTAWELAPWTILRNEEGKGGRHFPVYRISLFQ